MPSCQPPPLARGHVRRHQTRLFRPPSAQHAIDSNLRLPKEAKRILHSLAAGWSDVAESKSLEVVQLKGSMTNEVYQINWLMGEEQRSSRKVLVRIYGEGVETFFNRADEIHTFECISKLGPGPHLLGCFPNGRVEEFIHARTLSACDLRDPEISVAIATKLREFHDIDMPGPNSIILWDRLRNWLKTAVNVSSKEERKEFLLDNMGQEITYLQNELSGENQRIGFCHNDLQHGNIMMDEETRLLTIIDYDYAGYNPIAYDIANHFCEMAADYHTQTPHIMDYNKYPEPEEQRRFVRTYLASPCECLSVVLIGEKPMHAEVDILIQDIEKYTLASHLTWGLWGLISDHVNKIDFDYMEYARQRFQQYWLKKPVLLGSHTL